MKINKDQLVTNPVFTRDDIMKMLNIFLIPITKSDGLSLKQETYLFTMSFNYLADKLGAELDDEEQQMVDRFNKTKQEG